MRQIFVDTFYLRALVNPRDKAHPWAVEFARNLPSALLVTTDLVLVETGNSLAELPLRGKFKPLVNEFESIKIAGLSV